TAPPRLHRALAASTSVGCATRAGVVDVLPGLNRASGFRLLSLQSEPRSAVRCASDVSTDATPGDCVPTPPRPIPYGRGPVHGPKTAASRDVLSSPRTPTRSSASAAGRPLWRLRSPSRLDAQG